MDDKIEINVKIEEYEKKMKELIAQIKAVESDISKLKVLSRNKEELGRYKDEKTIERAEQKIQKDIEEQEAQLHKLEQEYAEKKSLALSDKIHNIKKEIKSLKTRKEHVQELPFLGTEFSAELYEKKYAELQQEINIRSATLIKLQEQKKALIDANKDIEHEAKAMRKAQIAEKKKQAKGPIFEAVPSEFDKEAYEKEHKYIHTGDSTYTTKKIKPGTVIDLNKIRKMSVTNIAGVLTGNKFGDYNEQTLKAMQEELASLQGKEFTPEYKKLSQEIEKAKNIIRAGKRGTAFHKIVELIETTDLTVDQLTKDKIKELEALYPKEIGQGSRDDSTRERLISMAKDYERLKKESGLSGKVTTEKSLGFLAQIGDEIVEITGTFDSFFYQLGTLLDFKTTSTVDPKKVGIQLNLLKKAIELHGGDVSELKILHTPFRTGGKTGVTGSSLYDVAEIGDEVIQSWIKNAFAGVAMEVPTLLKSTLEPYSWEEDGETRSSWMLNKMPIAKLPNIIGQGGLDEVVNAVKGLSPDDYKHFLNLLWSTKQYGKGKPAAGVESDKFYRSGAEWSALRKALPSFYTGLRSATGISEESFVDEEGNISGATTVGGGFLSQWSKAYRLKLAEGGEEAAQTVVDQFIKIIKDSTDEIGQEEIFGKLASLSFKDEIHNVFIDAVDKSLFGEAGSQFYSGVDLEQVDKLSAEVDILQQRKSEISKLVAQQGDVYTEEQLEEFDNLTKKIQELQNQIERLSYSYTRSPMFSEEVGINERSKEENTERAARSQRRSGERQYREQGRLISRLRGIEAADISGFDAQQLLTFIKGINSLKYMFKGALDEMGAGETELNEAGMSEFIDNSDYLLDKWYEFVNTIKEKIAPILEGIKDVAKKTGNWGDFNSIEGALGNLLLTEDVSSLTTKTAHRFSWLYQAKDIYDKMLESEGKPAWMSPENFAKLRLTPEQYKQYVDSTKLKEIAAQSGDSLIDLINNYLNIPGGGLYSDLGIGVQKSLSKIMSSAPDLIGTTFYNIISKQTTLAGEDSAKMKHWENVGAIERLRRGEEIQVWTPEKVQNLGVSSILINKIDDIIRNIINEASGYEGTEMAAKASLNLRAYLSQLGVSGGVLNRLIQGDFSATALVPPLNATAVQQNIKALEGQRDMLSDEEYQTQLSKLTDRLEEVNNNFSKYTNLLNQSRTAYSKQTAWSRESLAEIFKDEPKKLERVIYLVDLLEQIQRLPAITFGEKKEEQKIPKMDVVPDEIEVTTDAITIGDSATISEKKKSAKRRDGAKKKIIDIKDLRDVSWVDIIKNNDYTEQELEDEYFKRLLSKEDYEDFNKTVGRTKHTGFRNKKELRRFFGPQYKLFEDDLRDVMATRGLVLGEKYEDSIELGYGARADVQEEDTKRVDAIYTQIEEEKAKQKLAQTIEEEAQVKEQGVEQEKQNQEVKSEDLDTSAKDVEDTVKSLRNVLRDAEDTLKWATEDLQSLIAKGHDPEGPSAQTDKDIIAAANKMIEDAKSKLADISKDDKGMRPADDGKKNGGAGTPSKSDEEKDAEAESKDRLKRYAALSKYESQLRIKQSASTDEATQDRLQGVIDIIVSAKNKLGEFNEEEQKAIDNIEQRLSDAEFVKIAEAQIKTEEKSKEKSQAKTEKQQEKDIKDYQQYINKIVSLESQIDKLQKQAAISTGKHREAIYGAIDALNEEIGELNRNNDALVKRVSVEQAATKASIDSAAALKKQSNIQKNLVSVKGATSIWDMMANDIHRATMRIADFGIAAKVMNKIPQDIQKVIQYTKELNKVMTDIRIVTAATVDETKDMMRDYGEVARELGTTLSEVGTSASEWMRQGYEGAEVLDLIQSSTKLATLGFMNQTEATKSLTAIMKSFNIAASDTIDIVDKLTKLDQVSAISAGELAEGISRVATTAQQAGLSIDQTAAAISVLTEQTQRDAGSMGDALRTIIVRFQNVKAGIYSNMDETSGESSELTENLSDVEKVLSKVGIRVRSSSYEFRNIYDVLDELAAKWDTFDSVTKSAIGGAFAGQRQREQFNILISQWERVKELTEESEQSAGTADEKYTAYMDSMEAATKRLQNAWENFTQSLETSTVMKTLTNVSAFLVENADKLKYFITVIAAANSAKIFDFFQNEGETGGFKGLIANIPFFGRGTKTNNILESIDEKVGDIRGEVKKDKATKNGGLLSRLKAGFAERKELQKIAAGHSAKSARELATIEGVDFYSLSRAERQKYYEASKINAKKIFEDQAAMRVRAFSQTAAVAGISTLLTQSATDKTVGAGQGGILDQIFGINKALAGGSEQTMAETGGGKTLRVGLSTAGAVGGAATALIPVIGPAIAPIASSIGSAIGEGAASMISTYVHRSELEMKQRVADAKEQLKILETINSTTEKGNQIMSEKFLDSSGYEQLNKYVENLVSELSKLDTTVSDKILKAVRETGKTTAATISQLGDDILNASPEDRKEMQRALNVATLEAQYNQLIASQESDRYDAESLGADLWGRMMYAPVSEIFEKYGSYERDQMSTESQYKAFYASGETLKENLENAIAAYNEIKGLDPTKLGIFSDTSGILDDLNEYIKKLQSAINEEEKLDKELRNSQIQIAYLKSSISDLTQNELADLTIDGVAGKVVKSLEDMGIAVRDTSGVIKSEYLTQIKAMIKADSDMAILTKGDTKRIGELEAAWSDFTKVFGEAPGIYDKVREALDKGGFEKYLDKNKIQGNTEALEKLVYAADPERIEQFASAWNMTVEAALELAKVMPNLTTATGLMSTTEISEKMSKISTIFSDLSKDSRLTIENFNAILKNYPEYVDQLGDYEALLGSLVKTLTEESIFSYQNALFGTLMSDESYYKKFMAQLPEDLNTLLTKTNAKTLTDVLNLAQTDKDFEKLNDELTKFLDKTYDLEADNPLKDLAIEVKEGLLDKQISNLNEQKEALSTINDERKKELEYIKAKIALEDAQKEKKRVYVQGMIMPLSNYIG